MLRRLLVRLYAVRRLRGPVLWLLRRLEGDEYKSPTIREIFRKYWGVEIGMYTIGACFKPWVVDPNTTIGRYCSIADGVRIINGNHPIGLKSTHALFHNPMFGYCDDWIGGPLNPTEIGNDVWIGANAVILPEVNRIGNGAVIGAGAVVSKDVPDYAVVLGNPARVVKYRFSDETIAALLEEKWWEKDIDDLAKNIDDYQEFYLK
jgi:acetyltransferase-like isoleucine patch superfamily enzyme